MQRLGPRQLIYRGTIYVHGVMNNQIQVSLGRIRLYLERLERDVAEVDRSQALADCAELSEIARRL